MDRITEGRLEDQAGAVDSGRVPSPQLYADASAASGAGSALLQKSSLPTPAGLPIDGCQCEICTFTRNGRLSNEFASSAEVSEKQAYELLERGRRNRRAAELLAKYPFFEELVELLGIVPVKFIKAI